MTIHNRYKHSLTVNHLTDDDKEIINDIIEQRLCEPSIFNSNSDGFLHRIKECGFCPCSVNDDGTPHKIEIITGTIDGKGNPIQHKEIQQFSEQETEHHRNIYWEMTDELEDYVLGIKQGLYNKESEYEKGELLKSMFNISDEQEEGYLTGNLAYTNEGDVYKTTSYIKKAQIGQWFK